MLSRSIPTAAGVVQARFTERVDGDFAVKGPAEALEVSRRTIHPKPWTSLRQVHGSRVITVVDPDDLPSGIEADALVTVTADIPLAIQTADCGPVLLVGDGGQLGVAHAGWRGVAAGVLGATVQALRDVGAERITAVLGPAIGPECYEFGVADLEALHSRLGDDVASRTTDGAPALDLRAAIRLDLLAQGIDSGDMEIMETCTACTSDYFSHRARGDTGRQALVAWREPEPGVEQ